MDKPEEREFVKPIVNMGIKTNELVYYIHYYHADNWKLLSLIELFAGLEKLRHELQGDWKPDCDNRIFFTIGFDYWQNILPQVQEWQPREYCYEAIFGKWQKQEYARQAVDLFGDLIREVLK